MSQSIYTTIHIIYNPNSTGPSEDYAKELHKKLMKRYPKTGIHLQATEYAGHAEKLAYEYAKATTRPLIISSSGDGGYNEVINGALQAQSEGAQPITAVLAAGNANDHSRTMHDLPLFELIAKEKPAFIDVLKSEYKKDGKQVTRYAHSYIGLGLTPVVAVELNKTTLNAFKELLIVLKTFYKFRPFRIVHDDKVITLDSVLFTNIGEMAKVLTVSKNATPDDGRFEVVTFPHAHKIRLLRRLSKAAISGLKQTKHYKRYQFKVLKKMPAQLDGEVTYIDKDSMVTVTSEHDMLMTIV